MPVDPSLIEVVESLPRKHIQCLEQRFADQIARRANKSAKMQRIAELIGPQDIQRYDRLYLSGNGLSFVWYYVPDVQQTLEQISSALEQHHGTQLLIGLEPELHLEEDPKLHRMIRRGPNHLELLFGLRENDRQVFRGWRYHPVESDHVYTVVLKAHPFTAEIRAPFPKTQKALLRSLAAEVALVDFGIAEPCGLPTEALRDRLEAELPSELFGKWDVGTGRGLGSSRMYSDDTTPLREQQDFIDQQNQEHRRLTHLEYRFDVRHPFDDYIERAEYGVNLSTGDMRVGPRTSEIALEHLRTNVVRINTTPAA